MRKLSPFVAAVAVAISGAAPAQHHPPSRIGIFEGSTDIGTATNGSTQFDATTQAYRLRGGSGAVGGSRDEFRYAWRRMSEDGVLTATVRFAPGPKRGGETALLMFRQDLAPDAVYAAVATDEDGRVTLQYRAVPGADTEVAMSTEAHGAAEVSLRRQGDAFTGYVASPDGKLEPFASAVVAIHDPAYVGIGVSAVDAKDPGTVTFSDLHLVQTGTFAPSRLYADANRK